MSYQYPPPPPPPNGSDLGISHSSYLNGYAAPSTSSMEVRTKTAHSAQSMPPTQDAMMSLAQRRESLSTARLRKTFSTPNVRAQGANDQDQGHLALSNEKRRNKLGYHRTSVACGKYPSGPPGPEAPVARSKRALTPSSRPLPAAKDQMHPPAGGPEWSVHELHPPEEGVQLLPRRPAAAHPAGPETRSPAIGGAHAQDPVGVVFASTADGTRNRDPAAAVLSPARDRAATAQHGAPVVDAAPSDGKLSRQPRE